MGIVDKYSLTQIQKSMCLKITKSSRFWSVHTNQTSFGNFWQFKKKRYFSGYLCFAHKCRQKSSDSYGGSKSKSKSKFLAVSISDTFSVSLHYIDNFFVKCLYRNLKKNWYFPPDSKLESPSTPYEQLEISITLLEPRSK